MSLVDRVERMRGEARERAAAERAKNRETMPKVTAFVDEFREVFGNSFSVTHASEGGRTIGAPGPRGFPLSRMVIGPLPEPWNAVMQRERDQLLKSVGWR